MAVQLEVGGGRSAVELVHPSCVSESGHVPLYIVVMRRVRMKRKQQLPRQLYQFSCFSPDARYVVVYLLQWGLDIIAVRPIQSRLLYNPKHVENRNYCMGSRRPKLSHFRHWHRAVPRSIDLAL